MRKFIAALAATVTVTGMLLTANPAHAAPPANVTLEIPASSQPPGSPQGQVLCLANHTAACISAHDVEGVVEAVSAAVVAAKVVWDWIGQGKTGNDDKGEDQEEGNEQPPDGGGENNGDAGLCLAARGGNAFFTKCGDLGTTWIVVPHNDGYELESQYSLNNGKVQVLTVNSLNNGSNAYVLQPEPSGGVWWQTWSWWGPIAINPVSGPRR